MALQQWMQLRFAAVCLLLLWLTACVSAPQSAQLLQHQAAAFRAPVNLDFVPFFPQEDYQCGPAALATVLQASAVTVTPDELVSRVYVPARQGSLQPEMLAAARAFGRVSYQLTPDLSDVLHEVRAGRPVLVMQNLGLSWYPQWHYAVVIGYDLEQQELLLRSGTIREYRLGLKVFERTWRRSGHWAFVVLKPGEMPVNAEELSYFEAVAAFERLEPGESVQEFYRTGLQRWPDNLNLAMGLGNSYYSVARFDEAARVYQDLLRRNPAYAVAHNNLAQVLLQQGEHELALNHAQQAVELGGRYAEMFHETLKQAQNR
jgi:tetratricopeptide (TPR) repeat protein